MNSVLYKDIVLVLNRNWQAIHVKSPAETFAMLMTDTATALNIEGLDNMIPLKWKEWMNLSVREEDDFINTVKGKIRVPKVIVLCKFDRVPKRRPRFSSKAIWFRDNGTCQYTGKKLKPGEGNIDHVIPKSRGGKTDWSNCVLAHKTINAKKADLLPKEAGLKLLKTPEPPKELPAFHYIRNKHNIKEWNLFLKQSA